jgi:hypothetical protein
MDLLGVAGEQVTKYNQPDSILQIKNNFMSDTSEPNPEPSLNQTRNVKLDPPLQENRGSELPDLFAPGEIPTYDQVEWFSHIDKSNTNTNKILLSDQPEPSMETDYNYNLATKNAAVQNFGVGSPETGKGDRSLYSQMSPADHNKAILQERLKNLDQQALIAKDSNSDEDENNTFVG